MALSYKGIWGYAPLIITLANTREVLSWSTVPAMWSAMKAVSPGSIEPLS